MRACVRVDKVKPSFWVWCITVCFVNGALEFPRTVIFLEASDLSAFQLEPVFSGMMVTWPQTWACVWNLSQTRLGLLPGISAKNNAHLKILYGYIFFLIWKLQCTVGTITKWTDSCTLNQFRLYLLCTAILDLMTRVNCYFQQVLTRA